LGTINTIQSSVASIEHFYTTGEFRRQVLVKISWYFDWTVMWTVNSDVNYWRVLSTTILKYCEPWCELMNNTSQQCYIDVNRGSLYCCSDSSECISCKEKWWSNNIYEDKFHNKSSSSLLLMEFIMACWILLEFDKFVVYAYDRGTAWFYQLAALTCEIICNNRNGL